MRYRSNRRLLFFYFRPFFFKLDLILELFLYFPKIVGSQNITSSLRRHSPDVFLFCDEKDIFTRVETILSGNCSTEQKRTSKMRAADVLTTCLFNWIIGKNYVRQMVRLQSRRSRSRPVNWLRSSFVLNRRQSTGERHLTLQLLIKY